VRTIFGSSQWSIKIPGFPYQSVKISPFQRTTVYFPQSFTRPVLLIVPENDLVHDRFASTLELTIKAGKRTLVIDDYNWFVFWVGCGPDVLVPPAELATLRSEKARLRLTLTDEKTHTDHYPLLLDPSVNTPFSLPKWISADASEEDLEFSLGNAPTLTIQARDVSNIDKKKNPKDWENAPIVIEEQPLPLQQLKGRFVQVVHLDKSLWKTSSAQ